MAESKAYEVIEQLEYNRVELEDDIGAFHIVEEDRDAVVIEAGGLLYDCDISRMTGKLRVHERGL